MVMRLANHPHRTLEGYMQAVADGREQRTRGDVYRIALGIARGLAHVHDCGVVHHDLKREPVHGVARTRTRPHAHTHTPTRTRTRMR